MPTKLDLADAQFIGFREGKSHGSIISLVTSMGLTLKEWKKWKKNYSYTTLSTQEIEDIDEYFKINNEKKK